jgi:WD40 repeat protein
VIDLNTKKLRINKVYSIGSSQVCAVLDVGTKIVSAIFNDGHLKIFSDKNFLLVNKIFLIKKIVDVKLLKGNLIAVVSGSPPKVQLIDVSKLNVISEHSFSQDCYPTNICLASNYYFLLGSDVSGEIRSWNTRTNKITSIIKAHHRLNNLIKLKNRDDDKYLSCSDEGIIKIWCLDGNHKNPIENLNSRIDQVDCFPGFQSRIKELKDGRVCLCSRYYNISLWDLRTKSETTFDEGHSSLIFDFYQPDEYTLLSCSFDMNIIKWDLRKDNSIVEYLDSGTFTYRFEE